MIIAPAAVAVLLLVLPALAWWVGGRNPRGWALARVLLLIWLAVAVGSLVGALVEGDWARLVSSMFWPLALALPLGRALTGPKRASGRNSGPPAAALPC